ncbi:uncharacterized protein JN550_009785 [Neoarthrinium moseri]|uniref:uncharacterized protein n=1 Tax=Neoarthrinium moseri TaxID=1658444 RepID=UPI001FDBB48B|nr:uncharacterized protein JN550_009785 [Neoarthrinium moseri]KAI1863259.1 hypothetical protein JN550_009785 [Neoarthrinium moseri]
MCRSIRMQAICPTCNERISESTNKQICSDARRKGKGFGRCSTGVRPAEKEFRGEECHGCAEVTESHTDQLEMSDFAIRGLGRKTSPNKKPERATAYQDDSDDGVSYIW